MTSYSISCDYSSKSMLYEQTTTDMLRPYIKGWQGGIEKIKQLGEDPLSTDPIIK